MNSTLILSFVVAVLTIIFSKILYWALKYLKLRWEISSIPTPNHPLFLGILSKIAKVPIEEAYLVTMAECRDLKKHGICSIWLATSPDVYLFRLEYIETILRSSKLISKPSSYMVMKPWLGDSLALSTGEVWFHDRKLLTPAFHFSILEDFAPTISEKAEILSECIGCHIKDNPNLPVNIFSETIKCSLDTICETAMGVCEDIMRKPQTDYVKALSRFVTLAIKRLTVPIYYFDIIYFSTKEGKEYQKCIKTMHEFTMRVIKQKEAARTSKAESLASKDGKETSDDFGLKKRKAFLDLVMDASEHENSKMSSQQLREHVDTIMFGGHDTTGAALCWAIFALGDNLHVQEKVHKELEEVFGKGDYKPATIKELNQLTYLDRVIKEVLRLYTVVPLISRQMDEDVTVGDYKLPKGLTVSIPILEIHRDPNIWENPLKFDPDRFLPENCKGRHPYAFIPFSAGPRNCIGYKFALLEMKIVLVSLLRKFKVKSVLKHDQVKFSYLIILKPLHEILEIIFEPLEKSL